LIWVKFLEDVTPNLRSWNHFWERKP